MIITQVLFFILTYLLSGFIIAALLRMILIRQRGKISLTEINILGLGLGPILISLILYFLFLFFPNKAGLFYVSIVGFIFLLILIISRNKFLENLRDLSSFFIGLKEKIRSAEKDFLIMAVLAIAIVIYIFVQGVAFPIVSHDGCVYAYYGRQLYEQKNLDNYPMTGPDEQTGAFLRVSHPPGLPLLYTWFFLVQGDTQSDILLRTVSPMYAFFLIILLWIVLKRRAGKYCGIFGVLLMLSAPVFVFQSYANSIDPMRLFFIFSSFVFLAWLLELESINVALLVAILTGLAMYMHVTGVLILTVVIFLYLLFSKENLKKRVGIVLTIGVIAILIGGIHYGINYQKFNNFLGPKTYSFPDIITEKLSYSSDTLSLRGQEGAVQIFKFVFPKDLILGRLQIFSRPELFGFAYFIFLFAVFFWFRYLRKEKIDLVILFGVIFCAIPIIWKFYPNWRYIFTVYPLVIYFDGLVLGKIYMRLKERKFEKKILVPLGFMVLLTIVVFFAPSSTAGRKLLRSDQIKYLISSKQNQERILRPGLFAAIDYINRQTAENSIVLTFDKARYFYYAERKGILWGSLEMKNFYTLGAKETAYEYLQRMDIDFVLIVLQNQDTYFEKSKLRDILEDKELSKLIFEEKDTKVYQLVGDL